ncbi:MAG: hypothetical protein GC204_03390 [Chloroflexi bacterium]|nr:hypothetical protein [Chloroflexota bacterium]
MIAKRHNQSALGLAQCVNVNGRGRWVDNLAHDLATLGAPPGNAANTTSRTSASEAKRSQTRRFRQWT